MHTLRRTNRLAGTLLIGIVLLALSAGSALAACDPVQKHQADSAFQVALDFVRAKNWQQAIPQLESALSICDEHVPTLQALGRAYYATERFDESREVLEQLVAVRGQDAEARDYMDLGRTLTRLKDYRKARQAYGSAQRLDPENCGILYNLAVMHGAVKDYSHSVDAYERALGACPNLKDKILPNLAKACKSAAQKARGIGAVAEAEEFDAKYTEYANSAGGRTGYQLIVAKFHEKDYAGAVDLAEKYVATQPNAKNAWLSLGRAALQTKQYAKSIDAYKRYLALDPEDNKAHAALVDVYTKAGRCEEALTTARQADEKFSPMGKRFLPEIHYNWGKALECAGRYEEAKARFSFVTTCGDQKLADSARQEMVRQDQLQTREDVRAQNAGG